MQQPLYQNRPFQYSCVPHFLRGSIVLGISALAFGAGCSSDPAGSVGEKPAPLSGISLVIRAEDPAIVACLTPAAQSWATRTGARVELHSSGMTPGDDSDIGILSVPQ